MPAAPHAPRTVAAWLLIAEERTSQAAHLPAHGHERAAASADSIAGGARPPSERRPLRVDEKGKRPVCVGGPFGRPGLQLVRRIGARLDCGTAGTLATDALDAADVVTNRRAAAVMMAQCAGTSGERSASCEHWGAASASEMQMSRRAQRQKDARSMPSSTLTAPYYVRTVVQYTSYS